MNTILDFLSLLIPCVIRFFLQKTTRFIEGYLAGFNSRTNLLNVYFQELHISIGCDAFLGLLF